ncbi:MAG: acylneuraminate cytidylyltransferase family protein [Ruminococcus flavefaciens]|nr:acylneuraminate cytidylyltransferase family protein [Ruminococcus flavefaciens]
MFNGKKIMALIPARGGSKGVKRKNIRNLNGKPLIAYSILAAKESKYIDEVFVSTEDGEISEIAKFYGAQVPMMRPAELARDQSTVIEVVCHVLKNFIHIQEWDSLVLLQPTQPLRTSEDIDCAIEYFYNHNRRGLVSVSLVHDSPILIRYFNNHILMKLLEQNSTMRRQDMPEYYRVNGALYINAIEEIDLSTSFNDNPLGFKMDISHSVDIDEESDFVMAEFYMKQKDL